jgi:HAD superfamily hydrolase (TIGR01509 family)
VPDLSNIRAVAFDLDGVLLDTETINVRAAFDGFAAFGHPLDEADAGEIVGRHPVDYVPVLAKRHGVPDRVLDAITRRQGETYFRLWREEAGLMEGTVEALSACRDLGFPVALATSSGRAGVEEALDRFSLRPFFQVTLTKDDVRARKPDPEIYRTAAELLGVSPGELLVVEDSAHGIRSAKGAGAVCASVEALVRLQPGDVEPDLRLGSLLELPPLLHGRSD